ncbi:CPBP family intramembrane metalloprotease [Spiroplasma endosymbiont of Anurida maritima]|uniref:CPBP family intramembrane glutamic endopeptidase n=1 Tax=Spiroplasma endosymbiont of Anurida maritima TaxID=2967972 RepID=UPI0036D43F5A
MDNIENTKVKLVDKIKYDKTLIKEGFVQNFDFNTYDHKKTGLIFIFTAIIFPFSINILLSYLFADHKQYALLASQVIGWIIAATGGIIIYKNEKDKFIRTGAIGFYIFLFLGPVISFIISLVLGVINPNLTSIPIEVNFSVQIIAQIISIYFIFKASPQTLKRIKHTIKKQTKLLVVIVLLSGLIIILANVAFSQLDFLINKKTSSNQESLLQGLNKWWNMVLMFILVVLVAPVIEELATRHGIFTLCGNEWLSLLASTLFFAGMHIQATGEWNHLLAYIAPGFLLGLLFIFVNGNVTYAIFAHSFINLVSFILLVGGTL